jgi:integrase
VGVSVPVGSCRRLVSDRPAAAVRTGEVSAFLRELDRAGLTPRNVNKHRSVLSSLFSYGCRPDTFDLPANPVDGTDKRREPPPAALDDHEVDEVEALAAVCEQGEHRLHRTIADDGEQAARHGEDPPDAAAFRLLFYTGVRLVP